MFSKIMKKLKDQKGFTLIEMIFVVIILAVLTGVALINLGGSEEDAKLAAVKADFHTLTTAIKVYKAKTGEFPADLAALTTSTDTYKPMLDQEATPPDGIEYTYTIGTDGTSATISANTDPVTTVTVK